MQCTAAPPSLLSPINPPLLSQTQCNTKHKVAEDCGLQLVISGFTILFLKRRTGHKNIQMAEGITMGLVSSKQFLVKIYSQ